MPLDAVLRCMNEGESIVAAHKLGVLIPTGISKLLAGITRERAGHLANQLLHGSVQHACRKCLAQLSGHRPPLIPVEGVAHSRPKNWDEFLDHLLHRETDICMRKLSYLLQLAATALQITVRLRCK